MRNRFGTLFAFLAVVACERTTSNEPPVVQAEAPVAVPSAEAPDAQGVVEVAAPVSDGTPRSTWRALLAAHGRGLAGVTRAEVETATFDVSRNELVVMFNWPFRRRADKRVGPGRQIDHEAIATKLGANQVAQIPERFQMRCGPSHGGDFEVNGARYGIYVSGGCHHVRIFDATPDAVRLILGDEFVPMLSECRTRVLRACRTADEVRVQLDGDVDHALALFDELGGTTLTPMGESGWQSGTPPRLVIDEPYVGVQYAGSSIQCRADLPDLSGPEACGMTGAAHASDACQGSGSCRDKGLCTMVDGGCRATSATHCERSLGCDQLGHCTLADGACVATADSCRTWRMCGDRGLCTLSGDRCVAAGEDCKGLMICTGSGACTAVDGRCQSASDADCRASSRCARSGACTAVGGRCEAMSEADCAASAGCAEDGACGLRDGHCRPVTEAHCRKTATCQKGGYCVFEDGVGCVHCSRSDPDWPRNGWTWPGGECTKAR